MATATIILTIPGFFDGSNPPGYETFNSKPRCLFDDSTDEIMHWTFRLPENFSSSLVLKTQYSMASATSGNVIIAAEVMAVTDGDAQAVDSDSYDTVNTSSATAVPGTAGHMDEISLALTNADSAAAGDWFALRVRRDADNASDTASGDLELIALSLEYTAT